jgi:hypothetical protein
MRRLLTADHPMRRRVRPGIGARVSGSFRSASTDKATDRQLWSSPGFYAAADGHTHPVERRNAHRPVTRLLSIGAEPANRSSMRPNFSGRPRAKLWPL